MIVGTTKSKKPTVLSMISESSVEFHPTGSRFFGAEHCNDWDFFVENTSELWDLIRHIHVKTGIESKMLSSYSGIYTDGFNLKDQGVEAILRFGNEFGVEPENKVDIQICKSPIDLEIRRRIQIWLRSVYGKNFTTMHKVNRTSKWRHAYRLAKDIQGMFI